MKSFLKPLVVGSVPLLSLHLNVESHEDDQLPSSATDYSYTIDINGTDASATCHSVYGCLYALESFSQLFDRKTSSLFASRITISDSPDYAWRGIMIDSGRRFVPMATLEDIMDVMAANKLNVLHLHASDHCRFGVESKLFPNLTAALTGIKKGFYSQDDVRSLIKYAGDRGIRVVPEFDIPGHSRGFLPLAASDQIRFCTDEADRSQLYDDPEGITFKTLHALMGEMAQLFSDNVFNIGSDETAAKGICTVNNTLGIEKKILTAIQTDFKKTPEGWEEVLFDAGAATPETIVNAWARHTANEITETGRKAVESKDDHFYFTAAAPGGPAGWKTCWYDIGTNVSAGQKHLLLGGEMSMWTDTYCYINQCGAAGGGSLPVGHSLFDPAKDAEFHKSIGGMIWPRGYVGAAAFWNYDATTDPSSAAFTQGVWKLNDELAARGKAVCPSNCSCDQLSACGKPY